MSETLRDRLIREEGLELFPYQDNSTNKIWTIGVGHNMEADPPMFARLTEYQQIGISKDYAYQLLDADIKNATDNLIQALPWATNLDEARLSVLIDMSFNMGILKLLTFHNTLNDIKNGNYESAAERLEKSDWATEVGQRATNLIRILRTGEM